MFSLKPKKKYIQHQNKTSTNIDSNKQQINNEGYKQKLSSKKISKTIFEDPFNYHIQLLPYEQANQVKTILIQYINKLRESLPYKAPKQGIEKVIKFQKNKNIKQKLTPLISPQIVIGIKRTKQILYNHWKTKDQTPQHKIPHLTIIFYEERKHQLLVQLLCLIKILNSPYLLLRDNSQINRLLGIRTVGSLCLTNEQFANGLLKYLGKCSIDIPWVIQMGEILDIPNQKADKYQ